MVGFGLWLVGLGCNCCSGIKIDFDIVEEGFDIVGFGIVGEDSADTVGEDSADIVDFDIVDFDTAVAVCFGTVADFDTHSDTGIELGSDTVAAEDTDTDYCFHSQ